MKSDIVRRLNRKGDEDVNIENEIHKTCEEVAENCKKANTMSNIAIACGILSILVNLVAGLDKIESFARYVQSCLH